MIRHFCSFAPGPAFFAVAMLAMSIGSTEATAECPGMGGSNSDVPCGITLVGTALGVADARGAFTIVLRDLANNPAANCEVMIDFGACEPDIRISMNQPHPGVRAECDASGARILATTDANGTVDIRIVGAASARPGGPPASGFKCAQVYAGGTFLGTINVAATDLDGGGGANPADISLFLPDLFDADFEGRSDFNCSNTISPTDLSLLLQLTLGGGSLQSGGSYCN